MSKSEHAPKQGENKSMGLIDLGFMEANGILYKEVWRAGNFMKMNGEPFEPTQFFTFAEYPFDRWPVLASWGDKLVSLSEGELLLYIYSETESKKMALTPDVALFMPDLTEHTIIRAHAPTGVVLIDEPQRELETRGLNQTALPGVTEIRTSDSKGCRKLWGFHSVAGTPLEGFEPIQNNIIVLKILVDRYEVQSTDGNRILAVVNGWAAVTLTDKRPGTTFGEILVVDIEPGKALFIPEGCEISVTSMFDTTLTILQDSESDIKNHLFHAPSPAFDRPEPARQLEMDLED